MTTDEKLDQILEILGRMEARQIAIKTEVAESQPAVVGSFASTDSGKKK